MKHYNSYNKLLLTIITCLVVSISAYADDEAKHVLKVVSKPAMAGTFNTSSASLSTGEVIRLYAYANSNFTFKEWRAEDGTIISTAQNFDYAMPAGNATLTAVYEYNPANPANPAINAWYPLQGSAIIDDFAVGSLSKAITNAIGNSKSSDVQMITVAGVMNTNDFNVANNFSNCALLDISRVSGVAEVPSYAFDYTNLETVYLPASIEKIGARAFYSCTKLQSLTIYAMTPPTLESNVFQGVQEGLVVYAPAAAIAQYQDAEGWKNFTILPIQEDIRSLSVSLPDGANAKDFSQMWLELTNTKSGQKMHYVMTDRTTYTFSNIIRNTSWNVVLRNQRGDVFGKIDNIEVKDEDVSITFPSLSKPQNVTLTVKTPDGNDVTTKTQVTWLDADGNYLAQSTGLSGLIAGYAVGYRVMLSQDLAMQYVVPQQKNHVVSDGNNNLTLTLEPIQQVVISGCVKDAKTNTALSGATVTASQTFGGKYSKTVSTKTDAKGSYALTVSSVPISLAVSASDYISQTVMCDQLMTGVETVAVPDITLKEISGAVISIGLTYTNCPTAEDDEETFQNWYADYNNVAYSIFNKTKQKVVSQFNVQYPQIVLLEDVDEGDVLELTATSKTNAFMPVKTSATIDAEQHANATFGIVELGKIKSTFVKNSNATVVGSLYDANGKLVKSYDYSNASLIINDLVDGSYTLVTMGSSKLFNSIYDLSQLPQTGLVLGSDYTQTSVEVKSGKVSAINIAEVPMLDESKLYYTGDNTSFTVNKSSIVAGNYLTLTGHLDFKSAYVTKVSNVNLIVDIPESCEFVENSVMVGNSTSSYTVQNNRITIPMARYTDRVRFCIIPTRGGDYAPSALAQFDINGETVTQPIGSADYTAKDLSISVPSTVAKTTIPVSGTAIGTSAIEIYDGDVLIGQTTSLANGTWATTCELIEPYNLSTHYIYAKVTTKTGMALTSEIADVTYNKDNIVAEKVTMLYYNPEMDKEYNIVFDLVNGTVTPSSFYFFPYKSWPNWSNSGTEPKDFTFIVDLSNNDTTVVKDVTIGIYTKQNRWIDLKATYDQNKGRWTAIHKFEESNLPTGVKVDFDLCIEPKADENLINSALNYSNEFVNLLVSDSNLCNDLLSSFFEHLNNEEFTESDHALYELFSKLNITRCENLPDLINGDFDQLLLQGEDLLNNDIYLSIDSLLQVNYLETNELEFETGKVFISCCDNLNIQELINDGYTEVQKTNDKFVYIKAFDDSFELIDFECNCHIVIVSNHDSNLAKNLRKANDDELNRIRSTREKIVLVLDKFKALLSGIDAAINRVDNLLEIQNSKLTSQLVELAEKSNAFAKNKMPFNAKLAELQCDALVKQIHANEKIKDLLNDCKWTTKGGKSSLRTGNKFAKCISALDIIYNGYKAIETIDEIVSLCDGILPCENDKTNAEALRNDIIGFAVTASAYYLSQFTAAFVSLSGTESSILAAIPTGGSSLVMTAGCITLSIANFAVGLWYDNYSFNKINELKAKKNRLKCEDDKCPKCHKKPCECENPCPVCNHKPCICCVYCNHYPCTCTFCPKCGKRKQFCTCKPCKKCGHIDCICKPEPTVDPIHDPSGFVYEGVFSNRLEGVTATAYYKEMIEDMYGDLHENIVKWDAEEYAQENPLFTDENGYYRWDVPLGMWQVKFEKEGYETTYSDWLPVPPPQLDVNIAMKQNVQPNVKNARAYEDAVEVEFDKYMMPELLNTDNIIVMADGKQVEGSVELLNEEVKCEGETETFASKLRFNAAEPFEVTEITLMVNNRVKSYAGIRMQDNYSQSFTIEQEIRKIECESETVVRYGNTTVVPVSVLPASASAGKTVTVRNSSSMILGTDVTRVVLDDNGKAEIAVSGELPGTAALTFSIEGYDLSATTIVNVVDADYADVTAPVASIASGTTVEKGTKITLSCPTKGVTIYYTLDGTCPCDEQTRIVYTEPIIINESVTIKAMAVAEDMTESDIVEFTYIVDKGNGIDDVTIDESLKVYPLPVRDKLNVTAGGKIIKSVTLVSMSGSNVVSASKPVAHVTIDVSSLTPGIYIINVATEDKTYSRKIMKVE